VPLVDELQHAQQVLLEHDGNGQDRLGAEPRLLVPALVEAQVRVELGQLGRVVRILDIDGLAGQRGEAGDRRKRLRDADFLRRVPDLLQRIKFLILGVDRVDGEALGIQKLQDPVLERHQDVRDRFRGVDLVGDRRELFPILELPLERARRGLNRHDRTPDLG